MDYWQLSFTVTFRVPETIGKIRGFQNLPVGWHYGQGIAPSNETVEAAIAITRKALNAGCTETDAFVGVDGEIQVTIYHAATYLEFTVEPNQSIRFVREEGDEEIERIPDMNFDNALSRLEDFEVEVWRSSGSSTADTTIPGKDDFKTLPSRTPEMVPASQSSTMNALLQPV